MNKSKEEIVESFFQQPAVQHTLRLVPSSQRELFVSEMEKHFTTHSQNREAEIRKEERESVVKILLSLKDMPHQAGNYSYWHGYDVALEHSLDALTPHHQELDTNK